MYKHIFIDLDDTIFDFQASEKQSFYSLGQDLGLEINPEIFEDYHAYNASLWAMIEKGQLSKQDLLHQRFPNFFKKYGISITNGREIDDQFRHYLANSTQLKEGALDFLYAMKEADKQIYAASNGVYQTQMSRLEQTETLNLFDNIFISEKLGYEKPHPDFFYKSFDLLGGLAITESLMVGDRLQSDIFGAYQVGMATCWYNENNQENTLNIPITYESDQLREIQEFILKHF